MYATSLTGVLTALNQSLKYKGKGTVSVAMLAEISFSKSRPPAHKKLISKQLQDMIMEKV